jgi:NAD(P)-dependent dehydrogenase (short-subunit alcohol dehydrogenase family)
MAVLDQFRLDGKVALVTGGAGLFGRQIVRGLAEAGATVFSASRNLRRTDEEARALLSDGLKIQTLELDQGSERSVRETLNEILRQAGQINILVNNAVLRTMKGWGSSSDDFSRSMQVNATGLFSMTHTFGDQMASQGGGSIINIGSIQGSVGPDFSLYEGLPMDAPPDYFFHKGGLLQLTRYAAAKLGPRAVRVNAISPGGFLAEQDKTFVDRYNARTFLKRMANDSDLAGVVVFLASDASAYITGANIAVDGGYTAV